MKVKVYRPKDAVILGMAADNPKKAKKYIRYLSPSLRTVGKIVVNGKASQASYTKHGDFIEKMNNWGEGRIKIQIAGKTSAKFRRAVVTRNGKIRHSPKLSFKPNASAGFAKAK
jgi:hypothetical protein